MASPLGSPSREPRVPRHPRENRRSHVIVETNRAVVAVHPDRGNLICIMAFESTGEDVRKEISRRIWDGDYLSWESLRRGQMFLDDPLQAVTKTRLAITEMLALI